MKKHSCKIWSLMLAALLCMALLPVSVFAAGSALVTATVPVSVTVGGEEGTLESDIPLEDYTFKLTALDGAPMPDSDTITINGEGQAVFTIDFQKVGYYQYTVTQDASALTNERGNYDDAVYYVTVMVMNTDDGDLGYVVTAYRDTTTGEKCEIEFNNTYDPVAYPSLNVVKTAKVADDYKAAAGDTISYEIVVTNSGNVTVNNITVKDDLTGESWSIDSLAVNESETFTTSYVVTEADVVAGSVKNVATASGTDPDGTPTEGEGSDEVPTEDPIAHMTVTKTTTSTPADGKAYQPGETITYQITVTNDGNLTITDITVTDELTGNSGTDAWTVASLAPGESETFTAEYTVTEADGKTGSVTNTATATGTSPDPDQSTVTADPGTTTDPTAPTPETESESESETEAAATSPQTGDNSPIEMYTVVMVLALAVIAGLMVYNKKRKAE
ncbi:MAG: DUF11 domain-containing protein [Lachnospiraceae bacterium]|nr:DUF11 domain-containing protein [Lachnospiraceae bacterium]